MNIGQIRLDSEGGALLRDWSAKPEIKTIVEVGTGNGLGSTHCILEGLKQRSVPISCFNSYEGNIDEYHKCCKNYPQLPENVSFIYGTLTQDILDPSTYEDKYFQDYSRTVKQGWCRQDRQMLETAPLVINTLPSQIDLLVLDGGEFTTYFEWLLLSERSSYCFLDDLRAIKCARILEEMNLTPTRFKTLWFKPFEVGGRALFQRLS